MAEKVVIGNAELWHGDCREILPSVAAGSIVTSPPYGVGKEYERGGRLEWLALMSGFFAATDAEIVVLNLADVRCHEDKLIAPVRADVVGRKNTVTAQDVIDAAIAGRGRNKKEIAEALACSEQTIDRRLFGNNARGSKAEAQTRVFLSGAAASDLASVAGYYLHDSRVWVKDPCWQTCQYHSLSDRAVDEHEHVLCFRKAGSVPTFDRARLQVSEWGQWGSRSVWAIPSVRNNDDHPAKFPDELARRMVLLWGFGVVCDPFLGSGTTGAVCVELGLPFVGIERDRRFFDLACERIAKVGAGDTAVQGDMLLPANSGINRSREAASG